MTVAKGVRGGLPGVGRFAVTTRKARYGVSYFRAICSQAGVGFTATADEWERDAYEAFAPSREV